MKDIRKIDKILFLLFIVFCVFGLVMIWSASSVSTLMRYNYSQNHFFIRQLIVIIIGFLVGTFILFWPTSKYRKIIYILAIGVLISLIYVLISGKITNNAQSWITIAGFQLQPSEFAKTVLIIFMGTFYYKLDAMKVKKIWPYFIPVGIAVVYFLLIAKQPDMGSAAILGLICFFTFFSIPFIRKNIKKIIKILAVVGVIIIGIILLFGTNILSGEQSSRLNNFKNPCTRYQEDSGYQVCNSLIAISNGGLFGKGLGNSSQKYMYLPESHTDFIFSIICEELGVVGGIVVVLLYAFFLFKIYKIARNTSNIRNGIIAYGIFWYFTIHILVNLLGVLALIPLTGVPLPFLSYGGSYTLNAVIMIFVLQRIAIENNKYKMQRELNKI